MSPIELKYSAIWLFSWRKELHESRDSIDMGLELMKLSFNFTDWLDFVFIKLVVKKTYNLYIFYVPLVQLLGFEQ